MSEAIDTDQLVVLIVAKVTFDTDRWKFVTETFIYTDNDHMSRIKLFGMYYILRTAYYYSGHAVLIVLLMEG